MKNNITELVDYDNEIKIEDIYFLIFRHKNLLLLSILISLFISIYYTFTITPVYKSSTTVMINNAQNSSSMLFDITGSNKKTEIENEKLLIKSRIVAENSIRKLLEYNYSKGYNILGSRPYIPRGQKKRKLIKEILTFGFYDSETSLTQNSFIDYNNIPYVYINSIQEILSVSNQGNTDILTITFSSPFPDEAAIVANAIADAYKENDMNWANNDAQSIMSFIEKQSIEIEKNLSISEEKLKAFQENQGIYDLSGNSELLLTQLIDAESKYFNTLAKINIAEERKKFLSSTLSNEEKKLANNLLNSMNAKLLALRTQINQKESELVKNSTLHGEEHAAVVQLKNDISALKKKLDLETEVMIKQGLIVQDPVEYRQDLIENILVVDSELTGFIAESDEYKKLVDRYNQQLNTLPSLQLSYARLERDRSVLNQTYLFMRQELEKSRIKVASGSGKVQIIDRAVPALSKSSPKHEINLLLGIFFGFLIGIVLAFLLDYFDSTIKSIDEIEDSNIPILGLIPIMSSAKENHKINRFSIKYFIMRLKYYINVFFKLDSSIINQLKNSKDIKRHLITYEEPKSPISEAYRSIRTSLTHLSSSIDHEFSTMVVTSSGPGEGKTTTISNLAITYANLGKKVLLIDADFRKPVIHKVFNLNKNSKDGITSYLSGSENNYSKLIYKTEIENLNIIRAGVIPPNPSELLSSKKMLDFINKAKVEFDIILFDSPPLVAVTDASILSRITDKMIVIVMPEKTDRKALRHCFTYLNNMDISPAGIIFNGISFKNSYGSSYYYYQYYQYYGNE